MVHDGGENAVEYAIFSCHSYRTQNLRELWQEHVFCNSYSKIRKGLPDIAFGSGMQRAFEEGAIDKEEMISKMKDMGFDVVDN